VDIEIEPEVRAWLESLPRRQFGHVLAFAELLAEGAATLGEPYARHLAARSGNCGYRCTRSTPG
jgi:hypothetical protein